MRLDDVRILDLSRLLPGPYGTQLLADVGAEVVKIERPTGDAGGEPALDAVHRGKKSVAIDLKTDGGHEAFLDLAAAADVVLEQFRPGVVDRLGIDYETLREVNPELVYCSLSGYGQNGPYSDRAGHDLNYIGLAGLLDMTRDSTEETPRLPGYQVADIGGGLFAAFAIVAALASRELADTGGEYIDIGLADAAVSFSQALAPQAFVGENPRPGETPLTGQFPWYDVYPAAEGYVTLAALEPQFWRAFCEAVGHEEWVEKHSTTDPAELRALRGAIADCFAERTRDEWVAFFEGVDTAVGGVYSPAEALEHSQIEARGYVERPDGTMPRVGFPARGSDIEHGTNTRVAETGADTDAVLRDAGFDETDIDRLRESGAVE